MLNGHLIASLSSGLCLIQWFKLIIQNRPHDDDDDIEELNDINDVRNGFFANRAIHPFFDARQLAILKVRANLLFP